MQSPIVLIDVLIILAASIAVVLLLLRFWIGLILGILGAGLVIGPHSLSLVSITSGANVLAEFGVVFLLFMISLELSLQRLRALARNVLDLGSLQVVVTSLPISSVAAASSATAREAIVIGGGLALSSTAFVLQSLAERGGRMTGYGQVAFAILLLQDLAAAPMLIVVHLLADTEAGLTQVAILSAAQTVAAIVSIIAIGRFVLRPLYRIVAGTGSSELFVAVTLLVVLGISWAVSLGGFSMALVAFLTGLLLAGTEYRHQVETDFRPLRDILVGLFFIVIGMSIDVPLFANRWLEILFLVIALIAGKSPITMLLCLDVGQNRGTAMRTGILLSQGGEFGFFIFVGAMLAEALAHETGQILVVAITVSMAVTPVKHLLGARLETVLDKGPTLNLTVVNQETQDLSGHVVIIGFGRAGQTIAKALTLGGVDCVALDLHRERVTKCHMEEQAVFYGNGGDVGILSALGAAGRTPRS